MATSSPILCSIFLGFLLILLVFYFCVRLMLLRASSRVVFLSSSNSFITDISSNSHISWFSLTRRLTLVSYLKGLYLVLRVGVLFIICWTLVTCLYHCPGFSKHSFVRIYTTTLWILSTCPLPLAMLVVMTKCCIFSLCNSPRMRSMYTQSLCGCPSVATFFPNRFRTSSLPVLVIGYS